MSPEATGSEEPEFTSWITEATGASGTRQCDSRTGGHESQKMLMNATAAATAAWLIRRRVTSYLIGRMAPSRKRC